MLSMVNIILPRPRPLTSDVRQSGSSPHERRSCFCRGSPGEQVVDWMVDGPGGDHRVVPGSGHDVEDIGPLQLGPPGTLEEL